ncbi:DUF4328 domain-containing protein [Umezawaea sp. NPDC059074]|uniref:DUF4328 domain-containing protein n=1 Tax=Umezawaea sp. NPDC059074 TaxID=3346716 RepID=UPI0036C8075E
MLSAFSAWFTHGVVVDYLDGVPDVAEADLNAADSLAAALGVLNVLVRIAAGVVFIVWLWRARRNSVALYGWEGHRRESVWVGWAWFVPVVNLWFPYQVVQDVYRPSTRLSGGVVRWWWGVYLVRNGASVYFAAAARGQEITVESLKTAAITSTLLAVLGVVAAVLVVVVVRRIVVGQLVRVADPYASVQV